jgi:heptose-I-phosphate ethanolaminephosphotransferase
MTDIEQSKNKNTFSLLGSISSGIWFSLSLQFISKIDHEGYSFLGFWEEFGGRILTSAVIGGILFGIVAIILSKKNSKIGINILQTGNLFSLFVMLGGGKISFFFHFLLLVGLLITWLILNKKEENWKHPSHKNFLIGILIIGYFSLTTNLYAEEYDLMKNVQLLFSLSYLAIPLYFIPKGKRIYLGILILGLFFYTFPELYHIHMFGSKMPISVYYVMIESPRHEKLEYLSSYFNWKIALSVIGYLVIPISLIFFVKRTKIEWADFKNRGFVFIFLTTLLVSFDNKNYENNVIYPYIKNYQGYQEKISKFNLEIEKRKNSDYKFNDLKDLNQVNEGKTFVLIIGESTDRHHMGLYNYFRNTTPQLEKMKDELVVFQDVVSPHSHTMPSLEKVLSFANFESMEPLFKEGTIIDLFKQAGYKTYWLSNQFFFDEFGDAVTSIAKQSDYHLFVNNDEDVTKSNSYDEKLLKPLEIILNKKTENKLIILHLIGTHGDYVKRFPDAYQMYKNEHFPKIPTKNKPFLATSDYGKMMVNDYDNAVRYNDFVVSSIFNTIKKTAPYSFALYFSDHGEEVYDSRPYFSHQESNPTLFMFDIPFVLWCSPQYKSKNATKFKQTLQAVNKPYQTDDLIHTFLDLSNLSVANFNPKKSIINPAFKPEKRWMNNQDYDVLKHEFEIYAKTIERKKSKAKK